MSLRDISFSPERGLEAILYIAKQLQSPTVYEILKVRYLSDRLHLSRFGSIGSRDEYVAMQSGPVALNTYNLIKSARGDRTAYINPYFFEVVDGSLCVGADKKTIKALRGARIEYLSAAEIECIDEAIQQYANLSPESKRSNHDQAWAMAWEAIGDGVGENHMTVTSIAQALENSAEVVGYLSQ